MLPMIYMALVDEEDVPAFEEIYNRTYKKLYSIAFSILKDHQMTEDALSEMFLNISLNFKKINNLSLHKLDAYLVRSIRNTCYSYLRKLKSDNEKMDFLMNKNDNDEDDIFEKVELNILMEAIAALPEHFKTALVFKEYYGYKADEIAKQMKVSKRTVFYYIKAAKAIIIKKIEGSDRNEQ